MKIKPFRLAYFNNDFFSYCRYYFNEYYTFDTPSCLMKFYKALEQGKNVYFKGFRGSAKTTIAQMYLNYVIAYKKRRNIMRYSQTIDNAEENLTYLANSFIGDSDGGTRFVRDFGSLYYADYTIRNGRKKMKRLDKFITENECYVRAMSLKTSPRGKNYTASDGKFRPDLLVFDDVDTIQSCDSRKKIDKNYEFMLNEVFGGTTSACQMIFLGNTIYEDGLVPRFEEHIKNDKNWIKIILPIYEDGNIVWDRFVETDDEADRLNIGITESNKKYTSLESERRRLGSISFGQNYLLQPQIIGQHVIRREMIHYDKDCRNYQFDYIQIGVDPAISEKQGSDEFAITVVGFKGDKVYILDSIGLNGEEKDVLKSTEVVWEQYNKWNASCVRVETVAYQAVLGKTYRRRGMATKEYKTIKDKVTRLTEKQALFEDNKVFFYPCENNDKLIEQLLVFPNGEHDDRIDGMLLGMTNKDGKFYISSF